MEHETRPTYRDKLTRRFAEGKRVPAFHSIERQAYRRLELLESAPNIAALQAMQSNRFEALRGNRTGQFSIRINDQWRICFEWPDDAPRPFNIEIIDYH